MFPESGLNSSFVLTPSRFSSHLHAKLQYRLHTTVWALMLFTLMSITTARAAKYVQYTSIFQKPI